jgi:hypothetical protein
MTYTIDGYSIEANDIIEAAIKAQELRELIENELPDEEEIY